jgi:hypothetical protein
MSIDTNFSKLISSPNTSYMTPSSFPRSGGQPSSSGITIPPLITHQSTLEDKSSMLSELGIAHWKSRTSSKKSHKNTNDNLWVGTTVPRRFLSTNPDNKPYNIVQTIEFYSGAAPILQTGTFVSQALAFNLQLFSQSASLGAVFDQYRIAEIEIEFRPTYNVGISGMKTPLLYTVIDYDDQVALTGGAPTFMAYTNCVVSQFETVVRRFVPHCTRGILDSTGLVATENATAPWLDMADATVLHYGVKFGIDAGAGTFQGYTVIARTHLQLRNVR